MNSKMPRWKLAGEVLNLFLHAIHLFIVLFSITGWLFEKTRIAHVFLLMAIYGYWYILGPILRRKGWFGYCLITDLQWELKKRLGHEVPAGGYIKYLADRVTHLDTNPYLIDRLTSAFLLFCLGASILFLVFL